MTGVIATPTKAERLGFETDFSWEQYIRDRPVYYKSFYDRSTDITPSIQTHGMSPMMSELELVLRLKKLANRFDRVIVSDPSEDYIKFAAERLARAFSFPKDKFSFLQEPVEISSVKDGSVDLLVIFEAIHWTDIPAAIKEFSRQLKSGGTVAISLYFQPLT